MQISDLISKDSDRVFVVDHGCFIIFTGNTLNDTQPFIRIGNWPQMPVQLIDLIENIVITDELTGNPAMEQFNIDIGILSSNRYIGSHFTVKYYLDFQKIFGLDLTNAEIVDTEKDIPEIQGKNVSERGSFIGIFYNDGNFIIRHGSREFFNLSKMSLLAWDSDRIYDLLRQQSTPELYEGCGVVLAGITPLFYKNNQFVSYLFPDKYMHHFAANGIDPAKVSLLIHPSSNYLNAAPFLKWLKRNEGKLILSSDDKSHLQYVKKLFNGSIKGVPFGELNVQTASMNVRSISPGYNVIIDYGSFSAAYVRSKTGLDRVIKESVQLLFITYSVFEESNVLIKSSKLPYVIFDDGNPNVSRLGFSQENTIYPNTPVKIHNFAETQKALEYFSSLCKTDDIVQLFSTHNKDLADKIRECFERDDPLHEKCNLSSFIKYLLNISTDRRVSSVLESIIRKYPQRICREKESYYRCEIVLADSGAFITWHPAPKRALPFIPDDIFCEFPADLSVSAEYRKTYDRILDDRARLEKLVSLYIRDKENETVERVSILRNSIDSRRELFSKGIVTSDEVGSLQKNDSDIKDSDSSENGGKNNPLLNLFFNKTAFIREKGRMLSKKASAFYDKMLRGDTGTKSSTSPFAEFKADKKKIPLPEKVKKLNFAETLICTVKALRPVSISLLFIILLLTVLLVIFLKFHIFSVSPDQPKNQTQRNIPEKNTESVVTDNETPKNEKVLTEEIATAYNQDYINRFDISVSPLDTLKYLNMIAVKNGYAPLSTYPINSQMKNPHWIFPGNIFSLPDGGRIEVKDGDSLWKISELILTQRSIRYFEITEKIAAASTNEEKLSLIKQAEAFVLTEKIADHFKRISQEYGRDPEN